MGPSGNCGSSLRGGHDGSVAAAAEFPASNPVGTWLRSVGRQAGGSFSRAFDFAREMFASSDRDLALDLFRDFWDAFLDFWTALFESLIDLSCFELCCVICGLELLTGLDLSVWNCCVFAFGLELPTVFNLLTVWDCLHVHLDSVSLTELTLCIVASELAWFCEQSEASWVLTFFAHVLRLSTTFLFLQVLAWTFQIRSATSLLENDGQSNSSGLWPLRKLMACY